MAYNIQSQGHNVYLIQTVQSNGVNINNMVDEKIKDLENKRIKGGMLGIGSGLIRIRQDT